MDSLECLITNKDHDSKMSKKCRSAIVAFEAEERESFSLLPADVQQHCVSLVDAVCVAAVPGNSVHAREADAHRLSCLRKMFVKDDSRLRQAAHSDCRKSLTKLLAEEANDIQVDRKSWDACKADIEQFCSDIKDGQGRVHACLAEHMTSLSAPCRRRESSLLHAEMTALDVVPAVQQACRSELKHLCKDVSPGDGKLFSCLLSHRRDKEMNQRCLAALYSQQVK